MICPFGAHCQAGKCVCPTACPADLIEPVCSSIGITFNSDCEMRRHACSHQLDLNALFYGECVKKTATTDIKLDRPVIGHNGTSVKTTSTDIGSSRRQEEPDRTVVEYSGDGQDGDADEDEDEEDKEDEDGRWEGRRTAANCDKVRCHFGSTCRVNAGKASCHCDINCVQRHQDGDGYPSSSLSTQVCGSNGQLYANECILRQDSCKLKTKIDALSDLKYCQPIQPLHHTDGKRITFVKLKYVAIIECRICSSSYQTIMFIVPFNLSVCLAFNVLNVLCLPSQSDGNFSSHYQINYFNGVYGWGHQGRRERVAMHD